MRNLLFGNYLPGEDGKVNREIFTEVSSFDVLEKTVTKKAAMDARRQEQRDGLGGDDADTGASGAAAAAAAAGTLEEAKADPAAAADDAIAVLPNRFSLELTSHLSHVLSLPGGHAVVGARGGVGRRAATRLASRLSGLSLLEVRRKTTTFFPPLIKWRGRKWRGFFFGALNV